MDANLLNEFRKRFDELYSTEFSNGATFIWRPLSPYEYKAIYYNESLSPEEKEEQFALTCVLYSIFENFEYHEGYYDFSKGACYATGLTTDILSKSGFADDTVADEMLESYRSQMQFFENQIPCIIKMAFGEEVRFEDIEKWSLRKIFYYLSRAEWILNTNASLNLGLGLLTTPEVKPEGPEKKQKSRPKIDREVWQNMEWEEMSEGEFLRMNKPDSFVDTYDPSRNY